MVDVLSYAQHIRPANHFIDAPETELCHYFAQILSQEPEEVHDMIGITRKEFSKIFILRSYSNGAGVQMAFTHHDTTLYHQGCRCNTPLFRTQQRCYGNVASRTYLSVRLKYNTASQIVFNQRLMSFCQA